MRIQKNLDSAVNPERRLTFDSFLSHSFLLPQHNCAAVGTARCARRRQQEVADRKPGGCERPRGHNPRAVVTGSKSTCDAREGLCHLAVNWHHKWLFIEELRRSLARTLASNAEGLRYRLTPDYSNLRDFALPNLKPRPGICPTYRLCGSCQNATQLQR